MANERIIYVSQYYDDSEEEWQDSYYSFDPADQYLAKEAKFDAVHRCFSSKWRVIRRTETVLEEGVVE